MNKQFEQDGEIVYWLGNSLYLNITNRCSNECYFCFRHFWNGISGFKLKFRSEPSVEQVIENLRQHISRRKWKEVVFCGFGEPTIRLDCILEVAGWIKRYHPFLRIRLDTNGHALLLNPGRDVTRELKKAGIDIVSVSLNGHDRETYNRICKPVFRDAYESVIELIRRAKCESLDVEVTAVRLPEIDISKIQDLVSRLNVRFRVREYIPCFY
ncbi:TatD family nuclease-associated radical SAM protein [Candidatus Bathyarchaeota archaeon]|nr:TatD family nuclease-associated radical SAM protein [Candidatus Bathyarchaeota archaeon]